MDIREQKLKLLDAIECIQESAAKKMEPKFYVPLLFELYEYFESFYWNFYEIRIERGILAGKAIIPSSEGEYVLPSKILLGDQKGDTKCVGDFLSAHPSLYPLLGLTTTNKHFSFRDFLLSLGVYEKKREYS